MAFTYNDKLNSESLDKLYGKDLIYACEMFEIFDQIIEKELDTLEEAIQSRVYQDIKAKSHKIKPMYAMVGIPSVSNMCKEIEDNAMKKNLSHILSIMKTLRKEHESYIVIIKEEIKRMQNYLNKDS